MKVAGACLLNMGITLVVNSSLPHPAIDGSKLPGNSNICKGFMIHNNIFNAK